MALISAKTIIISLSLFHITLGFFFLTNPVTIADQALVYVIGEAMGMVRSPSLGPPSPSSAVRLPGPCKADRLQPYSRSFDTQSPALAFLAVILATIGITDFVTLSLPEEICMVHHWGSQGMNIYAGFCSLETNPARTLRETS